MLRRFARDIIGLDGLTYIIECLALDFTGEAKRELEKFIQEIESGRLWPVRDLANALPRIREALDLLRESKIRHAAGILASVNQELRGRLLNSMPPLEPFSEADDQRAVAILLAANIRGREFLDIITKLREGEYLMRSLERAFPEAIRKLENDAHDPKQLEKAGENGRPPLYLVGTDGGAPQEQSAETPTDNTEQPE